MVTQQEPGVHLAHSVAGRIRCFTQVSPGFVVALTSTMRLTDGEVEGQPRALSQTAPEP